MGLRSKAWQTGISLFGESKRTVSQVRREM